MKHKKLFVSLTAVLTVAVFLAIFLMIWFFGDRYKDFDEKFTQEFEIPGLEDGAVPQGMTTYTVATKVTGDDGKEETVQKRYFFVIRQRVTLRLKLPTVKIFTDIAAA